MPDDIYSTLSFEYKGIGKVLKAERLQVPLNQREYSWEEKQINDLFSDITNAIRTKKPTYFLGTIVLSKGKKPVPEVVDGQQRLATTTILLASIRDYYFSKNDQVRQTSIEGDFLSTIDRTHAEYVPKLQLNTDDNEYFRNKILSKPNSPERNVEEKRESHRRLATAADMARQTIQSFITGLNEKNATEVLNELVDFLLNNATVILLTVPDELNAFMMFETLNDRGLKTSQADLVKNYLFREAAERLQEAQQKWSKMIYTLESLGEEDIVMTYLRHLMITQYGPTREKDIFAKIQSKVSGRTDSIIFLDTIADYAESYAALLTPSHPKWDSYGPSIRRSVEKLRELRVQQIRPLMLAVAKNFTNDEATITFDAFASWTVRLLINGGKSGGQLEDAYGTGAFQVVTGELKTLKDLSDSLKKVIPSDAEFESAFSTARVSQHYLARYYLRDLEQTMRSKITNQSELTAINNTDILSLEHILPEEPLDNWPHITKETAEVCCKRIGNLTLMGTKPNNDFGSESFKAKRKEFGASPLLLNKQIFEMTNENTEWDMNDINKRQKELAKIAISTWPIIPKSK